MKAVQAGLNFRNHVIYYQYITPDCGNSETDCYDMSKDPQSLADQAYDILEDKIINLV